MTPQQWYDTVMAHLRQQQQKSSVAGFGKHEWCVYRTDDGNACAIGCTIPEGHRFLVSNGPFTLHAMEAYSDLHGVAWPDPTMYGLTYIAELGEAFQKLHDSCWWETKIVRSPQGEIYAQNIAESFDLVYTPPSKVST